MTVMLLVTSIMEPRLANHLFFGLIECTGLSLYAELLTETRDSVPGPFGYTTAATTTIFHHIGLQLSHIINS